jgi:hypothetical protein
MKRPEPVYHSGLLAVGQTIVVQFRKDIDFLSPDLLEYTGERQTTKKAARERVKANKERALAEMNAKYPGRNFKRIVID